MESALLVSRHWNMNIDEMLADSGVAMHTDGVEEEPTVDAKTSYAMSSASREPLYDFTCIA